MIKFIRELTNGVKDNFETPEGHTITLRGNAGTFQLDWLRVSIIGLLKILGYGARRYLTDGAQNYAELPIAPEHVDAWRASARASVGITLDAKKGVVCITAKGASAMLRAAPDDKNIQKIAARVSVKLDEHARAHAEARAEALYSGKIAEGNIKATAPEVTYLREMVRAHVSKQVSPRAAKGKLPGSVDALRSHFLGIEGIHCTGEHADLDAQWATMLAIANAKVESDKLANATLGIEL